MRLFDIVKEGTDNEFDMRLAKILKQRGYKGPIKLEQLGMKWVEAIGDIVDIDDYIMVQGKDPEYDGWVSYVFDLGKYAYGAEQGYTTGTAKRVEIDTRDEQGVAEGIINMMDLAKKAKVLLDKGMTEQQVQAELVKQGIPARLAAQATQMAQMQETVADQLTQENNNPSTVDKIKAAFKGKSPVSDKVKYGDTAYPQDKNKPVKEAPIAATDDPMDPMIFGHEKSNPMTLKGRILQTRKQLQELAQMAESDNLSTWMQITKLAKGGMFMGLEQNLEQVRHGLEELAAKRRKGGVQSRGIERFDETGDPAGTNAHNVNVGAVYKNTKGKTPKNKDGTAKNALDMNANLLTGGSIKR